MLHVSSPPRSVEMGLCPNCCGNPLQRHSTVCTQPLAHGSGLYKLLLWLSHHRYLLHVSSVQSPWNNKWVTLKPSGDVFRALAALDYSLWGCYRTQDQPWWFWRTAQGLEETKPGLLSPPYCLLGNGHYPTAPGEPGGSLQKRAWEQATIQSVWITG